MKIIFVASGNKNVGTVSAFVRSQYESLQSEGLEMILFPVGGHGWKAYTRAIWQLRALIRKFGEFSKREFQTAVGSFLH